MNYYTIKEISENLNVSKTTVQKAIKKCNIAFDYIDKNKQYYNNENTIKIIKNIKPDFEFANSTIKFTNSTTEIANLTTKIENNSQTFENNSQTFENSETKQKNQSEEIAALNRIITIFEKQLDEKDKQIQELSNRLAEALELTKGQQYITVTDKATTIIENEQTKAAAQKKNKSFFDKLFNRNND